MSAKTKLQPFSEEEFGKRMDRCVTDLIVKGTSGLITGAVLSLIIFKRKSWPIYLSTGMGIGMAFKTCDREMNTQ